MKKVLIAYYKTGGTTQQMAGYIGEGVRIGGQEADVKEMGELIAASELAGYDGYIFGSPTYSLDVPEPMKKFLSLAPKSALAGKPGAAFGSYTHDVSYHHDNHAPAIMLKTLQDAFKMKPFELGPLILQESLIDTDEGMRACHDWGKTFAKSL